MAATLWVVRGIEAEDGLDGLLPGGAVASRVDQTHIKSHMLTVVGCERLADRRLVEK